MPGHGRRIRRLVPSFATAATGYVATAMLGTPAWAMPADNADAPTPCWSDQIAVTASPAQAAVGHRATTLVFSLAGGAEPCTLTGYPGVDSGAGGPLIHAQPTPRGYMGGLPGGADSPPTVILSLSTQAQAVVEGIAIDADGDPCPTYTELLVNPPDTTVVLTVPVAIDACALQVHPVTPV
ncbi:DUF4232 domain-containing protein [Mycobacterium sp. E3247]|uniref:DUF4232 domain-containing protein n=1 Tax=Mycobacterium sp. E3247 TaxID=1856864 RepID=UPI0018D2B91B|nr:DUF4232 domain-containing protein [Mycobacterium sp. E3247]